MLFGTATRRPRPGPQPVAQPTAQPQYAAPTWPGQTEDGTYSSGLANHYAGMLQNQQVPGSVVPQVVSQTPLAQPPAPAPGPITNPGFRDHPQPGFGRHFGNRLAGLFGEGGPFANMFGGFGQGFGARMNPMDTAWNSWLAQRPADPNSLLQWAHSAPTFNGAA